MYIKSIFSVFGIWGQKIITWTLNLCRDAIAILLLGLGIVSFLSCISYSPDDSSFLQATGTPSNNLLGLYGSTYADFILQTLGYSGYIISALLMIWGFGLFRGRIAVSLILRLMYMPPILMLFSASLQMLFGYFSGPAGNGVGGHIGTAVSATILYFPEQMGIIPEFFIKLVILSVSVLGLFFIAGRKIFNQNGQRMPV